MQPDKLIVPAYHLLIVDDHPMVRDAFQRILTSFLGPVSLTAETASNGAEALSKTTEQKFDLVLMDFNMPGKSGDQVTKDLLKIQPDLKIIGLSVNDESYYKRRMLDAGAKGYVSKTTDIEKLVNMIHTIIAGEEYCVK